MVSYQFMEGSFNDIGIFCWYVFYDDVRIAFCEETFDHLTMNSSLIKLGVDKTQNHSR